MYQRILVAMDGGAASDLALEQAMVIALAANAEVEVVHVVDDRSPSLKVTGPDPVRLIEDMTTAGEGVLATAASRLAAAGIRHVTLLLGKPMVNGDIAATIAEEANGRVRTWSRWERMVAGGYGGSSWAASRGA